MSQLTQLEKQILAFFKEHPDTYYTGDQIAQKLNYKGAKMFKQVVKALNFFEGVGELELGLQGKYRFHQKLDTVQGVFRANAQGFGFIEYDPNEGDLFVPPGKSLNAMHGDKVEAKIIKHINPHTGKGSEAQVLRIIERASSQLVGEFFAYNKEERAQSGYLGYVKPQGDFSDQVKIWIEPDGIHPADHTICIAKITGFPSSDKPNDLFGKVSKEIGHVDAPGVDILAILFQFGIPHEFPEIVKQAADGIPQEIQVEDLAGRRDLRSELIITIDGADAKDLDDAISLKRTASGNFVLGVHIADVSHYVTENSPIDREAFTRGTSVYLTDRVVPMLPQRLSNGICSLHAHEDRLTITCEMQIDSMGQVVQHDVFLSVINSAYRMTYSDVNAIIAGDQTISETYHDIVPMIDEMTQLHKILEKMRRQRGALDFDAPEAKVIVDEDGHPLDIQLRTRGVAERLIESFMLVANETIARIYTQKQLPFMYRVHEQPAEDKMNRFAEFLTTFGVILRGNVSEIEPKQLQVALDAVKGQPHEQAVSTMMLRSMQQAKYSENPEGHYGLAARDYTHFTSPIRRYPDLIVHRLLHRYLKGQPSHQQLNIIEQKLPEIAIHSSKMERRAVDAERETNALKKAEFMVNKIEQEFDGRISSITNFGIFVELDNTIEGLIHLQSIKGDYFEFDQAHMLLIGKRTGRIFRIGQAVKVRLINVNVADREIDFELLDAEPVTGLDVDMIRQIRFKQARKSQVKQLKQDKQQPKRNFKVRHKPSKPKAKKRKR